uniref:Glycerate kinase n=1 Tax=candidate division WOR-3 bacterium TaxID=2052148 RepID=A0A7V3KMJ1_UNCW3
MNRRETRERLIELFYAAIRAGNPYHAVALRSKEIRSLYQEGGFKRLVVTGFGKAAYPMAKALEDNLGNVISNGIIITKYGHATRKDTKIKTFEAGHPIPDEMGLNGTEEIIKLLEESDENTFVICLISGGGSALLVAPEHGISLKEKQEVTQLLLESGADINEVNTVRKHLSRVKGGRLAEIAYPARVISLILSDVIGDRLDVIASGPTEPDRTTFQDALYVLEKYKLATKIPSNILNHFKKGAEGFIVDTPKVGNPVFQNVQNIIIGSNKTVLEAARQRAEELGFQTEIITYELSGEARKAAKWLAFRTKEIKNNLTGPPVTPICLLSSGETTVTVRGNGLGGRNIELALSFAMEIEGVEGITMLSAGTDGTDGPTEAAGAIVDGTTVKKAKALGLYPENFLNNNDSYRFFERIDGLFITGPTGTNVMDIQIILIED